MKKESALAVIIILIFVINGLSGCISENNKYDHSSYENGLTEHTCSFDNSSLDLKCSPELRILLGYERFLTEEPIKIEENAIAYYYDTSIYSETSNSNINEIYKTLSDSFTTNTAGERYRQCSNCEIPKDKNASVFFTEPFFIQYRKINVSDIKTNETFSFYVSESKIYNVSEDNTIELSIDLCKENQNTVCMPDQHWRCYNYDITSKACDSLVSLIAKDQKIDLCYELEKENLIAYCLAKIDLNKCFEYSKSSPEITNICETTKCQEENKVEYEPGKFSITNYCEDVYNSN